MISGRTLAKLKKKSVSVIEFAELKHLYFFYSPLNHFFKISNSPLNNSEVMPKVTRLVISTQSSLVH